MNDFSKKIFTIIGILIFSVVVAMLLYSVRGGSQNQETPKINLENFRSPDDADHFRGNKDAKIVIVEYSDLECPACKAYHAILKDTLAKDSNIKWIFRHFPLSQIHPKAVKEAEGAECVAKIGGNDAFWKFTDRVYEITPGNNGLDLKLLPEIATFAGIERTQFEKCLQNGEETKKVKNSFDEAVSLGARGTPFSVIISGGNKIPLSGTPKSSDDLINFLEQFRNAEIQK